MKKLILCATAAAGLMAGGGALASGTAECQQGMTNFFPVPEHCHQAPRVYPYGHPYAYGAPHYPVYGARGYPYGYQQVLPSQLAWMQATPYPRTARDRDGDGVRNRRDRYPDDPRYR